MARTLQSHLPYSIHVLVRRDKHEIAFLFGNRNFNSHALAGRDMMDFPAIVPLQSFQLTRPSRGVTLGQYYMVPYENISTHTPLAGRDEDKAKKAADAFVISTHTPLAGRDTVSDNFTAHLMSFQLTRPSRGVTLSSATVIDLM